MDYCWGFSEMLHGTHLKGGENWGNLPGMVSRIMLPPPHKDVHVLIYRACEHTTLQRENFADRVKDLEMGKIITRVPYKKEMEG